VDGALLVNKHAGVSSFGVIEELQDTLFKHPCAYGRELPFTRKRELPKMGHGGTLDPFATGLLAVCVGRGVKLARYFLGSRKTYEGVIRFGETTVPGDPTEAISERSDVLPESREQIQELAHKLTLQPYLQTPPMHSAKKKNGKALYELAREGIEIEREAKQLQIFSFEILSYEKPRATFRVECSAGTYVRTLSQDLGRMLGTVAMLDTLHRTASGIHSIANAMTAEEIMKASAAGKRWDELPAWMPFDRLLDGYDRAEATQDEAVALFQGRQTVLPGILARAEPPATQHAEIGAAPATSGPNDAKAAHVAIYHARALIAVARQDHGVWGLERVFTPDQPA
jgi:tRNA pseudouridine55 synthase